jgi:hypothetical protein
MSLNLSRTFGQAGLGSGGLSNGALIDIWPQINQYQRGGFAVSDFTAIGGSFLRNSPGRILAADGVTLLPEFSNNVLRREAARGAVIESGVIAQPCNTAMAGGQVGVIGSGGTAATRVNLPNHTQGVAVEIISIIGNVMRVRCFGTTTAPWNPLFSFWGPSAEAGASVGNWWHNSVSARLVSGTWPLPTVRCSFAEMNGGTVLTTSSGDGPAVTAAAFADGQWRRLWTNLQLAQATVDRTRLFLWASATTGIGIAVDFTIEFQLAMRHQTIPGGIGSGTSPIVTGTTDPVTRAIEDGRFALAPVPAAHTMVFAGRAPSFPPAASSFQTAMRLRGGSLGPRIIRADNRQIIVGGGGAASVALGQVADGQAFAVAYTTDGTGTSASLNGGAVASVSTPSDPAGMSILQCGTQDDAGVFAWEGEWHRGFILPRRLNNAELQAIATRAALQVA